MGLGPASRGLNDVTTETRVFRQQVSQLPEMSSVLFASAWVTLARPLAAPRCGSLSESSAARAVRTGRGAQRRDRGVRAPGASESGRGAAVRPGLEAQLPRGSRGSRRASPWSPGPGRDDAKRCCRGRRRGHVGGALTSGSETGHRRDDASRPPVFSGSRRRDVHKVRRKHREKETWGAGSRALKRRGGLPDRRWKEASRWQLCTPTTPN